MRVEYHPESADDLNGAIAYYNHQRPGLGDALRLEVYAVIERVSRDPQQFRVIEDGIRRCLVRRFPYSVLFRIAGDDLVRILAIRHHRRHAAFGLRRN